MGLSTGEVAGLPNGGGVTTEEAPKRESPAPYTARGWGSIACAFALHASPSLGRCCWRLGAKGGEKA
jgi:hypothetical protein